MRGEGYSGQRKTFLLLLTWPISVFTDLPFLENDTHSLTQRKMALVARLSLAGAGETDPEDFFSGALGVIFPDDVTNRT